MKAALLPSSALTACAAAGAGPHTVYVAPSLYADWLDFENANLASTTIIGVAASGNTAPATQSQVFAETSGIISNSAQHTVYCYTAAQPGISIQNLVFTTTGAGKYCVRQRQNASDVTFVNCYLHDSASSLARNEGTGSLSFSKCKLAGSGGYGLVQGAAGTMVFDYCIIGASPSTPLTSPTGVGCENDAGVIIFRNCYLWGAKTTMLYNTSGATINVTNCIIGTPWSVGAQYTIKNDAGGVVNAANNLLMPNYVTKAVVSGSFATWTGNITNGNPRFYAHQRRGIISLNVDDTGNAAYVSSLISTFKTRGVKGTWFVFSNDYSSYAATAQSVYADRTWDLGVHSTNDLTTMDLAAITTEMTDQKAWVTATFSGWTGNVFATPYGKRDANVDQAATNIFAGMRSGYGQSTATWFLSAINPYGLATHDINAVITSGLSGDDSAAADVLVRTRVRAYCDYVAASGSVLFLIAHTTSQCTVHQWGVIIDTIKEYPDVSIKTADGVVDWIHANCNGALTSYTYTWTDQGNYRTVFSTNTVNMGAVTGLTSDFIGNPINMGPDIGLYENQIPGFRYRFAAP